MSEVEKQESQKTVVAFITGLLIGGLLVWVFSSTPEVKEDSEVGNTDATEVATTNTTSETTTKTTTTSRETVGDGSITILDQEAGKVIVLGTIKLPTKNGWIVVRDYMDGVPGNILGAARYSTDEGLMPTSVELMRATTAGSSYQVVFYTNEGTSEFTLGEDTLITGIATTFKAN